MEQHPKELSALRSIQKNIFFNQLTKLMTKVFDGKPALAEAMDRKFPVTAVTCPELYGIYQEVQKTLGLQQEYPLFLEMEYNIGAKTLGDGADTLILLSSGSVETLNETQLKAVIGHELGHIMFGHQKYYGMVRILRELSSYVPSGLADQMMSSLIGPFLEWMEAAEYTADQAAVLASGSSRAVQEVVMMEMGAELNTDQNSDSGSELIDFTKMKQKILKFDWNLDRYSMIAKILLCGQLERQACPWGNKRLRELQMQAYRD